MVRSYKSRLCPHYLRGRCTRSTYCNLAHGTAQLRQWPGNRSTDLRQTLNRRRSPPGTRRTHARDDTHRSVWSRIGTGRHDTKRQQLDSHGKYSRRSRVSGKTEEQVKAKKVVSPDSKVRMEKKLTQLNSEIKVLDKKKRKLEICLGDKVQEADTLKDKIHELETRQSREKEEGRRITTRIKKFIKAHKLHQHLQVKLKSSNAQLQELGEQLDMHDTEPGYERIPIITDDDGAGGKSSSPSNESPKQKRMNNFLEVHDTSNRVTSVNEDIGKLKLDKLSRQTEYHGQSRNSKESDTCTPEDKSGRETSPSLVASSTYKYKVSEVSVTPAGIMANVMDTNVVEVNEVEETLPEEGVASKDQDMQFLPPPFIPQGIHPESKVSEAAVTPTGITAHVMDENVVEVNEMGENSPEEGVASKGHDLQCLPPPPPFIPQTIHSEYKVSGVADTPIGVTAHMMDENVVKVNKMEDNLPGIGVAVKDQDLPFLPPPPPPPFIPQNIETQYKGNDADVDVSGPEEEAVGVDVDVTGPEEEAVGVDVD